MSVYIVAPGNIGHVEMCRGKRLSICSAVSGAAAVDVVAGDEVLRIAPAGQAAVNCFDMESTWKTLAGVMGTSSLRLAIP
jgi:hypothetical protein